MKPLSSVADMVHATSEVRGESGVAGFVIEIEAGAA